MSLAHREIVPRLVAIAVNLLLGDSSLLSELPDRLFLVLELGLQFLVLDHGGLHIFLLLVVGSSFIDAEDLFFLLVQVFHLGLMFSRAEPWDASHIVGGVLLRGFGNHH